MGAIIDGDRDVSSRVGQHLREATPRSSHATWSAAMERPDPVSLIERQNESRVAELVPLRHARMLVSPFTFLRGAAVVMAHDLAATPTSGLRVEACGDAHLSNFGLFGTPERNLLFDVNDFDETLPAPWEWDVKRLATSVVVAGRDHALSAEECRAAALGCVRSYRERMREMAGWGHLEVWYTRVEASQVAPLLAPIPKQAKRAVARVRQRTQLHDLSKLTEVVDGRRRLIDSPPLMVHPDDVTDPEVTTALGVLEERYRRSLDPDKRMLLDRYEVVDIARKVVGVGSVGTRCYVLLLLGRTSEDPLFLQVKEAQASVLAAVAGPSRYQNQGQRVVLGQRLSQAASDIFLGWARGADDRDYYVRQLHDMKASVDTQLLSAAQLADYSALCGWALARAHARSGDPGAIADYLGKADAFDNAVAAFAEAYADQTERDHATFADAARSGRIAAAEAPVAN